LGSLRSEANSGRIRVPGRTVTVSQFGIWRPGCPQTGARRGFPAAVCRKFAVCPTAMSPRAFVGQVFNLRPVSNRPPGTVRQCRRLLTTSFQISFWVGASPRERFSESHCDLRPHGCAGARAGGQSDSGRYGARQGNPAKSGSVSGSPAGHFHL
jgi:hypothetical protein